MAGGTDQGLLDGAEVLGDDRVSHPPPAGAGPLGEARSQNGALGVNLIRTQMEKLRTLQHFQVATHAFAMQTWFLAKFSLA